MPEQTFEERLAQQLSMYAEAGVRPFDPHAVARTTISSRARWGRLAWPMQWQGSTARSLRLALTISLMLALMLLAMLASGALLPGGTLPSSSGLFVWADGVATFIGQDGERATRSATSPRGDSCPVLVGSSGVVAQGGFGQIQLTDLVGELRALPLDTDYAGGERWSPDHRRIALFRFDGTVTVVSLVDPEAPQETTFDMPGVIDVAWAADGRHLAVARQVEDSTSVAVDLMEVSAGSVEKVHTFTREGVDQGWGVQLSLAPDGSRLLIGQHDPGPSLFLGDVATGDVVALESSPAEYFTAAWAPDGRRLAVTEDNGLALIDTDGVTRERIEPVEDGVESLSWSPDGSHLAFIAGDSLTITDPRGAQRAALTLQRASYQWAPDGSGLYVASADLAADGAPRVVVQRYAPDLIPLGEPVILPGQLGTAPICFARSDVVVTPDGRAVAP